MTRMTWHLLLLTLPIAFAGPALAGPTAIPIPAPGLTGIIPGALLLALAVLTHKRKK